MPHRRSARSRGQGGADASRGDLYRGQGGTWAGQGKQNRSDGSTAASQGLCRGGADAGQDIDNSNRGRGPRALRWYRKARDALWGADGGPWIYIQARSAINPPPARAHRLDTSWKHHKIRNERGRSIDHRSSTTLAVDLYRFLAKQRCGGGHREQGWRQAKVKRYVRAQLMRTTSIGPPSVAGHAKDEDALGVS